MDENKHLHRRDNDDNRLDEAEDEQLRGNTMNEAIREVHGNPDMDISGLNDGDGRQGGLGRSQLSGDDLRGGDSTLGSSYNPNDASAVRSGGTTDMDDQTSGGAGLAGERMGSTNINTKRNVTGSDFDGQTSTS